MAKTIIFAKNGIPSKVFDSLKVSKELYWMHVDQSDDEGAADLIAYELSDMGISHDITQHLRPNVRYSDKHHIIKLVFPREAGIFTEEKRHLVVRFIISRNSVITVSNDSEEIRNFMNEVYANKTKVHNVSDIFNLICSHLLARTYDTLENIDNEVNLMQRNIFTNNKKKENFMRSERIRERVYHAFMILAADVEVFEELKSKDNRFIRYDHRMQHLRSKLHYMKDVMGGQRENLLQMPNVYLGMLSSNMGKYIYRLSIFGAVLLVPAIIASFYSISFNLSQEKLLTAIAITIAACVFSGLFMSWWTRK